MTNIKFFLGLVLLSLIACSSNESNYKKTIADFVQTDKRGTKYDLKFKVLELKEIKKMTVADSIQYLENKMNIERAKKIETYKKLVADSQTKLKKAESSKDFVEKFMKSTYEKNIEKYKKEVTKWEEWNPDWTSKYEEQAKDKLLAVIVYCKYSAIPPMMNTTIEETRYFVLSPDGKNCYKQIKELK